MLFLFSLKNKFFQIIFDLDIFIFYSFPLINIYIFYFKLIVYYLMIIKLIKNYLINNKIKNLKIGINIQMIDLVV